MTWSLANPCALRETTLWVVLIFAALSGLLALVHPRWFKSVAAQGSQWIDSARLLAWFNHRYDIDGYVLPYTRLFGVLVIASIAILASRWLG
jgi:hypothetical protein